MLMMDGWCHRATKRCVTKEVMVAGSPPGNCAATPGSNRMGMNANVVVSQAVSIGGQQPAHDMHEGSTPQDEEHDAGYVKNRFTAGQRRLVLHGRLGSSPLTHWLVGWTTITAIAAASAPTGRAQPRLAGTNTAQLALGPQNRPVSLRVPSLCKGCMRCNQSSGR